MRKAKEKVLLTICDDGMRIYKCFGAHGETWTETEYPEGRSGSTTRKAATTTRKPTFSDEKAEALAEAMAEEAKEALRTFRRRQAIINAARR